MDVLIDKSKMMTSTGDYYLSNGFYPLIIRHVAFLNGYDITIKEATDVWSEYSDSIYCNFACHNMTDFDSIWNCIKPCFEITDGSNKKFVDILFKIEMEYLPSLKVEEIKR